MFNYSLATPSFMSGIGAGQYTLPWDYMTSNLNNTNYLYNSLNAMNPYMMQGYNFYNPTFTGNNTSTSKKQEKLEYTPVYASDEIYKTTEQTNKKDNKGLKYFGIAAAIVVATAGVCALVSGAKSFDGTTWQYLGNLCKSGWGGVENLFKNTAGKLGKPLKAAGGAVASGTKKCWGAIASGIAKIFTK